MVPLEYLSVLNSETKEKLIGLCLDKKLMGNSKEDEETMYEEEGTGEEEEDYDDEEDCCEEEIGLKENNE